MERRQVIIHKTWRSEIQRFLLFLVLSVVGVVLSQKFPGSVVTGKLFSVGGASVTLSLPLFWLIPTGVLMSALAKIYDVLYIIDGGGIESRVGIISLHQVITRIRFEDIKSIESEQTLVERILNIGTVEMGTAATEGMEMIFQGVAAPREIQRMVQAERDARTRKAGSRTEAREKGQIEATA